MVSLSGLGTSSNLGGDFPDGVPWLGAWQDCFAFGLLGVYKESREQSLQRTRNKQLSDFQVSFAEECRGGLATAGRVSYASNYRAVDQTTWRVDSQANKHHGCLSPGPCQNIHQESDDQWFSDALGETSIYIIYHGGLCVYIPYISIHTASRTAWTPGSL